eukprot:Sspe_Gene.14102::Locus_4872_Transcript_1_2_Confidence_0.600_Length_452::g.14102::m.14102
MGTCTSSDSKRNRGNPMHSLAVPFEMFGPTQVIDQDVTKDDSMEADAEAAATPSSTSLVKEPSLERGLSDLNWNQASRSKSEGSVDTSKCSESELKDLRELLARTLPPPRLCKITRTREAKVEEEEEEEEEK